MTSIVELFNQIKDVDIQRLRSLSQKTDKPGPLREDRVGDSLHHNDILTLAPKSDSDFILVPKVLDR